MSAVIVIAVGFIAFSFYRLRLWTVGDAIAWKLGWSAPSLLHRNGKAYDEPYVHFLKWKYSAAVNDALVGYLSFRWAVAHFVCVSGIALLLASFLNQLGSLVPAYPVIIRGIGAACVSLGFWQCAFLYIHAAAIRELREETGIQVNTVVGSVSDRRFSMLLPSGETVFAVEQYFVVHAENNTLSSSEWTLQEIQVMTDHHWWSAHELRSTGETVWPEALVEMLVDAGVFKPAA